MAENSFCIVSCRPVSRFVINLVNISIPSLSVKYGFVSERLMTADMFRRAHHYCPMSYIAGFLHVLHPKVCTPVFIMFHHSIIPLPCWCQPVLNRILYCVCMILIRVSCMEIECLAVVNRFIFVKSGIHICTVYEIRLIVPQISSFVVSFQPITWLFLRLHVSSHTTQ